MECTSARRRRAERANGPDTGPHVGCVAEHQQSDVLAQHGNFFRESEQWESNPPDALIPNEVTLLESVLRCAHSNNPRAPSRSARGRQLRTCVAPLRTAVAIPNGATPGAAVRSQTRTGPETSPSRRFRSTSSVCNATWPSVCTARLWGCQTLGGKKISRRSDARHPAMPSTRCRPGRVHRRLRPVPCRALARSVDSARSESRRRRCRG